MVIGVPDDDAADPLLLLLLPVLAVLLLVLPLVEHALADARTVTATAAAIKALRIESIRRSSSPLSIRRNRGPPADCCRSDLRR